MIQLKTQKGTEIELLEITKGEAVQYAGTGRLVFDSPSEEMEFYKEVLKNYPPYPKKEKKASPLSEIIAYLDEEDIHEIIVSIVENKADDIYKNLDLEDIMMYLNEEDVNLLFQKALTDHNLNIDPVELVPYLSEETLTFFVDEYLEGNYQDVDIDELYPYMCSSDIKRLFRYFLLKKEQ